MVSEPGESPRPVAESTASGESTAMTAPASQHPGPLPPPSRASSDRVTLDPIERETYRRHLPSTLCESVFTSICWAGTEIAVKGFEAGILVVTLITMAPGVMQFLSLFAAGPVARVGRRRLLRISSVVGRAPIVLVYFVGGPYSFLTLLCLQAAAQVFITTSWNSLLSSNYRVTRRGVLYARVAKWGALVGGVVTVGLGFWLDHDPDAFRYGYPIAAVFGVVACFLFAEIPVRPEPEGTARPRPGIRGLWHIVREDRAFRRYELGFFLYGLGFMSLITAKPIQTADPAHLGFDYSVLLGAKGAFSLLVVLATVSMGRRMDRLGPAGMASRCFALLTVYSALLIFVREPWQYLAIESLFGFAMAGILIAWNMGPVTLAPTPSLAGSYMLIHVALVGVRASIAHPLGGWLVDFTGDPRWVFGVAIVFFVAGAATMHSLARQLARDAEA